MVDPMDAMGEPACEQEPDEHTDVDVDVQAVQADGWVLTPQHLRAMRVRAGLNQRQLAHRVHCSWQAVWTWETGTRGIPVEMYLPLVEACTAARRERDLRLGRARAGFLSLVTVVGQEGQADE